MTTANQATVMAIVVITFVLLVPLKAAVSAHSCKQSGRFQLTTGRETVPSVIHYYAVKSSLGKGRITIYFNNYQTMINASFFA